MQQLHVLIKQLHGAECMSTSVASIRSKTAVCNRVYSQPFVDYLFAFSIFTQDQLSTYYMHGCSTSLRRVLGINAASQLLQGMLVRCAVLHLCDCECGAGPGTGQ